MNYHDFLDACTRAEKTGEYPSEWSELLKSLAFDRASDWDKAHAIAQDIPTPEGSAIHAYLHRKEGVQWNADYWYKRAGRTPFTASLESEWESLVKEFLR